ncbi:MAG: phytoene/squalene synthase family protein [Methyloligellaceae bacterium]
MPAHDLVAENSSFDILAESLRTHDRDAYIACLLAPPEQREALMVLHAFSIDVGRIPELVSEPMLGEIRLQWWRDALEQVSGGAPTGNPVADSLGAAVRDHDLPLPLLQGMIDARAFDLSGEMMPDDQAMRAYLVKTSGNLIALACRVLDAGAGREYADLAIGAGQLRGLVRLLRLLPFHLSKGRFYLPLQRFEDAGADVAQLRAGAADEKAREVIAELRGEAVRELGRLREAMRALPQVLRPAFLPLATLQSYLRAMEKERSAPLVRSADISPLTRVWRIAWRAVRGVPV